MSIDPITLTLLSTALAATTTVVGVDSAQKNAYQQRLAVDKAGALEQMDLTRQSQQQAEAGASQMNDHARKAREDAALLQVISGETGGGATADRLAAIGNLQAGEGAATISSNVQKGLSENAFQANAAKVRQGNQLASISGPSMLGAALTIGGQALKGYGATQPKK